MQRGARTRVRAIQPTERTAPPQPQPQPPAASSFAPGRRAWFAGILTGCLTSLTVLLVAEPLGLGLVDDAYISMRYAVHWAEGTGLCFNVGERVEGYTNTLFVVLLMIAARCGAEPTTVASLLPALSLGGLACLLVVFTERRLFPGRLRLAAAAALVIALNPAMVCWATSGMETCLYALLLTAAILSLATMKPNRGPIVSAVLFMLAAMTRPEAAALAPLAAVVLFLRRRHIGDALHFGAVFGIGFGAYFATRAIYFGRLLPNTFYAKLDYGNALLARRGLEYTADFLTAAWPTALLCVCAVPLLRSAPRWVAVVAAFAVAQLAIVTYEGGDHFAMFRFLIPIIPLLGLMGLYSAVELPRRLGLSPPAANIAILLGIAAVGASGFLAGRRAKADEPGPVTHHRRFLEEVDYARQWKAIGSRLRRHAAPDATVATVAIGAVGYFSDLGIVDPHGLIDPVVARGRRQLGTGTAGHEKFDVDHVLSKRPSYILLVNYLTLEPIPAAAVASELWGDFNRRIHADPRLAMQYRYEHVKIADRWLNIHVRRDVPPW